ncbi:DEA(D/H)-box RNA helicase family protein isoform X2 [Tasmannia lanceolata]|uniref:DEA(D/H)-box RNA helicase family protein isoform X2 n=1 Tax=Tasmannia lanceolata TaxID=3420 RepID=UPI004062BAD0
MLIKSPLHFPSYLNSHSHGKISQPYSSLFHNHQLFCSKSVRLSRKKWPEKRFSVKAGYTRKMTGTPGAYHLIDDETGEKFIVWGGIEDENADFQIPSKEVLLWNSGRGRSEGKNQKNGGRFEGGVKPTTAVANSGKPTSNRSIYAASFGKLKAQRVRALIKKSSGIKKENADAGRELDLEPSQVASDASDSEVEFVVRRTNAGLLGYKGKMLGVARPKDAKDTVQNRKITRETNSKDLSNAQVTLPKPHEGVTELNVSVPRAASSLRGWSNASSTQRTAVDSTNLLKQRKKPFSDGGFFSRKSFKDLGCGDDMIESLKAQLFHRPSHIQAMSYIPVLEGKSCIIADQSGSGKTLAYLAPVIQCLREEELQGLGKSSSGSPRVVVLVPTAELASQLLNNCRSIAKFGVPFRSMVATGGFRQKTQLENLQESLDVLIATPGRFKYLLQEGFLQLTNLKCVVFDEVDILFGDEGFKQVLQNLINSAPVTTQYLFATATLPVDIYNKLVELFPDCEVVMGPGMHRTSSGLEEVLVDCSGGDGEERSPDTAFINKRSALLQLVEENPVPKTIVFCNKIETCRKVENVLKRFDRKGVRIQVLPFHAALAQDSRLANMKEFLDSQSKDSLFLICTDRASRGIDFTNVDHVVLFDFPRDPSEYVRRVGRTARGAGGKGKAFVFVVGKQVSLAQRIMERNLKGHPLHDVPSSYELVR